MPQGELDHETFARNTNFDHFVLSYKAMDKATVYVVDRFHLAAELGKVRRWRANQLSKVYVHGMRGDGELILLHTYPSKVETRRSQAKIRLDNG